MSENKTTTEPTTITTIHEPTVSPEVSERALLLKLKMHMKRAQSLEEKINPAQGRIMRAALITPLLGKEADVPGSMSEAINTVVTRRAAKGIDLHEIEMIAKLIIDRAADGDWDKLLDVAGGAAPEANEPVKEKNPEPVPTPPPYRGGVTLPDMPKIEVPPVAPLAAGDPMAGLVGMFQPRWEADNKKAQAETMAKLGPVLEELVKQINLAYGAASSTKGSVDEEKVKDIITKALGNGAGEEIKRIVASSTPGVLSDVLEKAARAVASTAPEDEEEVDLKAAFLPIPDPHYAWTPELEAQANLIEQASNVTPQNAMLVGPTGAGKSEYAMQYAAKFGRQVMFMDCANIREARDWFGHKGAGNGKTYFKRSQFWKAVETGNLVIVLDEFNRAPDHVRNTLMPILDPTRRASFVEEVGELLKVGPRTVFFATLNEGLEYSGTHTTDRAMKNRFPRRIELTYLPEEKEIKVLMDKVGRLKKSDARKLVELANVVRQKAASFGGTLSETISTRQLIAAAQDFVIGGAPSFRYTIINHFNADGGTDSERAQVVAALEGKGFKLTA